MMLLVLMIMVSVFPHFLLIEIMEIMICFLYLLCLDFLLQSFLIVLFLDIILEELKTFLARIFL